MPLKNLSLNKALSAIGIGLIAFGTISCKKDSIQSINDVDYGFFVAGHTYGSPGNTTAGIYPPFAAHFDALKANDTIQFGVLTGDVVPLSTPENWEVASNQLSTIGKPIYIAPGNHDLTDRDVYKKYNGDTYYSFYHKKDLFIVLDPLLDHWNISGDQWLFFENHFDGDLQKYKGVNIFIFFHQVLWWSPENKYKDIIINWGENKADSINFFTQITPLLKKLPGKVYLFAGDVGAGKTGHEFVFLQEDNLCFIASGMGGGERDNYLSIMVKDNRKVSIDLIALNGNNPHSLGKLEDYKLP